MNIKEEIPFKYMNADFVGEIENGMLVNIVSYDCFPVGKIVFRMSNELVSAFKKHYMALQ